VSLGAALLQRATQTPEAPALEFAAGTWSFADLAGRARCVASHLQRAAPDATGIGLLIEDPAQFAAWFLGAALAERTVLPLNWRLTAGELAQQLADARANLLLGAAGDPRLAEVAAQVRGLRVEVAPAAAALTEACALPDMRHGDGDEATLAVLFTSGTTGRARGACLSWRNFHASALAAADRLGPAVRGRWLACMPLFHVGGLSILVRSLLFGGPVRLQPRFEPTAVSDALDAGDVAGVSLVPTMLSRLLAHRGTLAAPPGLQVVLLGGAAAAPELLERALAAGYPLCPTYGLTEATSQVATAAPPASEARRPAPMLAVRGTELRILAAEGAEAPVGMPGEILLRGPTVMQGYLHHPAATARALRDGWLHTGDVGYLDAEGGLHVLDRREDLIVSGGENVYPAEVEAVLLERPSVEDAGVAGVPDVDLGARVVAWIVVAPDARLSVGELQQHCRERLAGFKQPREFRFVDALPRNAAGKLQRRRLAESSVGNAGLGVTSNPSASQ
jgi:O-succinylbenzoic acid--CoA ligase